MKKRPKNTQIVYYLFFDDDAVIKPLGITVSSDVYESLKGGYRYNLFTSYKLALAAKRKIVRILRGEG